MPFKLNSSNNDPITIGVPVNMSSTLNVNDHTVIGGNVVISGDNNVSGNVTFGKLTCGSDANSVTSEQFSNLIERIDYSLAKPQSVKFNKFNYLRDDANKTPDLLSRIDIWTNATLDVTYENGYIEHSKINYQEIMKSGQSLPKTGSSGETVVIGQIHDGSGNVYIDTSGNNLLTSWTDGTSLIKLSNPTVSFGDNYNTLFIVNQYEAISDTKVEFFSSLSPINVTTLKQNKKTGELTAISSHNLDTTAVKGLYFTCNASLSPWNTHISSEEYPPNSWGYHCYVNGINFKDEFGRTYRNTDNSVRWGGDSIFQKFLTLNQYMFGLFDSSGDTMLSPYHWGYIPEVTVNPDGTASVVKHYSMGRRSYEIAQVMPDQRTVLFGNDSAHGCLFMYIADVAQDLSAGKLYAAKLTQTSASNGGSFTVEWILLGHATDAEVAGFIDTVMPGDMYDLKARDSSGGYSVITPDGSGGYITTYVEATDDGYIKSRIFNDFTSRPGTAQLYMKYIGTDLKKFAFLESSRCAEWLGATCETKKLEGVALNIKDKIAYYAMSAGDSGNILADTAGESDDMRISAISHGVVMKALLGGGYNTIQGSSRNIGFIQEAIDSEWVPYQLTGMPELRGSSSNGYMSSYLDEYGSATKPANPDNLRFSEKLRTLFISEDTSLRSSPLLWAFNVDTLVTSNILSAPFGSESTGLSVYDDINGFSYCTTSFQHIGLTILEGVKNYFGDQNVIDAITKKWGANYVDITSIGYLPLPYISGNSQELSIVAKQVNLTDSSGNSNVLNGDLVKALNDIGPTKFQQLLAFINNNYTVPA
jgi:hypothetical protein